MDELVRWFGEQLDEDERISRGASWTDDANAWHAEPSRFGTRGDGQRWFVEDAMDDGVVSHVDPAASEDEGVARHIAEWDPARVLREIDAKRRRLARHAPERRRLALLDADGGTTALAFYVCTACTPNRTIEHGQEIVEFPCPDVRGDVAAYAHRPGYRQDWRP